MMSVTERLQLQAIDRFWETIPPLWGTIRTHIRAEAARKFDISVEQFHILRHVRRGIGSISELAAAKNISRPAISQAVDVLVKKGLLTRIHSSQDRRFVELTLTDAGNNLLDTVFQETREWMQERMSSLTTDELQAIAKVMTVLKKMLD
ncbi:MAG TPA: MarR family transcriptional regulator [Anaerolineales bacterium]|nr:MarR family transcriptional regulator [Anaerolineales bacterium]